MLTWGLMRQKWFSKESWTQWGITSHPSQRSEHDSRPNKCLVNSEFRPAVLVLRILEDHYIMHCITFLFPEIMWTYSPICQGHEMTEQSWAGLEKAGTCSCIPSWAEPVQVPGTVWGAQHHCKVLIDGGIPTRFQAASEQRMWWVPRTDQLQPEGHSQALHPHWGQCHS